jgi:hypothetical protein
VFRTGVAGFLCPAVAGTPPIDPAAALPALPHALLFTSWPDFANTFRGGQAWLAGIWLPDELLWGGVQGFFGNGGTRCWVVLYDVAAPSNPLDALDIGIGALAAIDDVDLVCAPSLMTPSVPPASHASPEQLSELRRQLIASHQQLIRSCEQRRDDWFLILDAPPPALGQDLAEWLKALRQAPSSRPYDAAVYHPWLVPGGDVERPPGAVATSLPPSGHIAGIFARTDRRVGVHKAPANEPIEGIVDVGEADDVETANPLRAFPGRGIRVWGARTLATGSASDGDVFVNVRRLLLTLERWLVRALDWVVFEANDLGLWVRVNRELNAKLNELFLQGVFAGKTPSEAFSVKCDADNNPDDVRATGKLQIDIQIAPVVPKEFIQIRVIRNAERLTVT